MNSYELSRYFFDWSFENPEKITPNHVAVYFFAIEHCNRLGWKEKFGFPTEMAKESIGIKSYKTYMIALNDLVEWGFIKMVQRSKNQYSANIVALVKNTKALPKALSKATLKHRSKQDESNNQSISTIDKHLTTEPITIEPGTKDTPPAEVNFLEQINLNPFSESFRAEWEKWIDYKKSQWKQTYKRIEIQQTAFKHLLELSKNDPERAKKIIDQSIGNLWKGLIELKNEQPKQPSPLGTHRIGQDWTKPL